LRRFWVPVAVLVGVVSAFGQGAAVGQGVAIEPAKPGSLVVVFPFDNRSRAPGLDWIGESFPEVLGPRVVSAKLLVVSRNDRSYAFDRAGIPAGARISRATLFKFAQAMDVDYAIVGSYSFDGRTFSTRGQLVDVKRARLLPEVVEAGALTQLQEIQSSLTWDLLRQLQAVSMISKQAFVSAAAAVRLDALEQYVRGVVATDRTDRLRRLREAVRIAPTYTEANLALGQSLIEAGQYEQAAAVLTKVAADHPQASEAQFFLGLASYRAKKFEQAQAAFEFVAQRVPLIEVYNNLGVVAAQLGKAEQARKYFERAARADSREPDYHYNLGITLYRAGDQAGAQRELKDALALRPQDVETKTALDACVKGMPYVPGTMRERIKRNYDETQYRQIEVQAESVREARYALMPRREHAEAHVQSGMEMLADGRLESAETAFREAILLDPTQVGAHIGLAEVLETRNELPEARAEANAANRLKVSIEAFLVLARIDLKQKRYEAAGDNLERALKMDPGNAEAAELRRQLPAANSQ
jgi:Tfp pilus assembly protein PilF/TolB-like protein